MSATNGDPPPAVALPDPVEEPPPDTPERVPDVLALVPELEELDKLPQR